MSLLAAAGGADGLPIPADLTGVGVLVFVCSGLVRLWWIERRDRITAQDAVLELTRATTAALTEVAGSARATSEAVDRLADEIRRDR